VRASPQVSSLSIFQRGTLPMALVSLAKSGNGADKAGLGISDVVFIKTAVLW